MLSGRMLTNGLVFDVQYEALRVSISSSSTENYVAHGRYANGAIISISMDDFKVKRNFCTVLPYHAFAGF